MERKKITLKFDLEQVANDILAKCNLISTSIRDEALTDIKAQVLEPDSPETRSIINRAVTEAFGNVKAACQRYLKTGRTIDDNTLERMVKEIVFVKKTVQEQAVDNMGCLIYDVSLNGDIPVRCYREGEKYYNMETGELYHDADATQTAISTQPDDGHQSTDEPTESASTTTATIEPVMVNKTITTDEIDRIIYETLLLELFIPNFNTSVTDALKSSIHRYIVDYTMGEFLRDQLADKSGEYATLAEGKDYGDIIKHLSARDRFNMRKPSWI